MRLLKLTLMAAFAAAVMSFTATTTRAQGRRGGNFDPAQFRERMMERYRDQLGVTDDAEWKLISDRISKVMDARRDVGFGGGFRPPRRQNADNANAGDNNNNRRRRGFGGEPSPEAEALQAAIDSKASAEDIKAKLAKYRESRKAKQAKLQEAQDDLRKVLSVRQEAAAVLAGLLD